MRMAEATLISEEGRRKDAVRRRARYSLTDGIPRVEGRETSLTKDELDEQRNRTEEYLQRRLPFAADQRESHTKLGKSHREKLEDTDLNRYWMRVGRQGSDGL